MDDPQDAVSRRLQALFGPALLGVYLHGSAVDGGLRPQSDLDLLAVIDRPPSAAERRDLTAALLRLSGPHPAPPGGPRCLELMVFERADLSPPAYPARCSFVYGEWLRAELETGGPPQPLSDPEHSLVLAQARRRARRIFGLNAETLLPEIPSDHVRRALGDALPALLDSLEDDARNVLLTLARIWRTAAEGDFLSKDAAADWAIPRLPAGQAAVLKQARDAYLGPNLGHGEEPWRGGQAGLRPAAQGLARAALARLADRPPPA